MASYSTNLKTWGASGSAYPDAYNYVEGEQPVDDWDNFLTNNIISDIKGHLIPLTNSRIESDTGTSGSEPSSPEASHLYHDTDNERLELWDAANSAWHGLMFVDGDTMSGALGMGGNAISGVTDLTDNAGNKVYDYTNNHVPAGRVQQGSGSTLNADQVDGYEAADLGSDVSDGGTTQVSNATDINFGNSLDVTDDGDGTATVDAVTSSDTHTGVSEDGTQMYASVDDINFQGHLNLVDDTDGTVSLDPSHTHPQSEISDFASAAGEIFVQGSAPSSPSADDIWIDTT